MAKHKDSKDIEAGILGLFLFDNSQIDNSSIVIEASLFHNEVNKAIFQAMASLHIESKPIDIPSVLNILSGSPHGKNVDQDMLLMMERNHTHPDNLTDSVDILIETKKFNELINKVNEINLKLDAPDMTHEMAHQELVSIAFDEETEDKDFIPIKTLAQDEISTIENYDSSVEEKAIYTDIKKFDNLTSGFRPGQLVVLAARPGMGKTAFAIYLSSVAAQARKKIAFFSLEMSTSEITRRFMQSVGHIDGKIFKKISEINTDDTSASGQWNRIKYASDALQKLDIFIDDSSGTTLESLVAKSTKLQKRIKMKDQTDGLDLIVVDYLQLIEMQGNRHENRQAQVSRMSRTLKKLAGDLKVPIIALSQLSRAIEVRDDKTPLMSDLRESGAIEQDADIIAFIHDPIASAPQMPMNNMGQQFQPMANQIQKPKRVETGIRELLVLKNRSGERGSVKVHFAAAKNLFSSFIADNSNGGNNG